MDADEMDIDLDGAGAGAYIDSPLSAPSASGSLPTVLSELAALHRRASSSATSPSLSLASITYLSAPAAIPLAPPRHPKGRIRRRKKK